MNARTKSQSLGRRTKPSSSYNKFLQAARQAGLRRDEAAREAQRRLDQSSLTRRSGTRVPEAAKPRKGARTFQVLRRPVRRNSARTGNQQRGNPRPSGSNVSSGEAHEAAGDLARGIFKGMPFHADSFPPVKAGDSPSGGKSTASPITAVHNSHYTVATGKTVMIVCSPEVSVPFVAFEITNGSSGTTWFNKDDNLAINAWPFTTPVEAPPTVYTGADFEVERLYAVKAPSNIRATFGAAYRTLNWPTHIHELTKDVGTQARRQLASGGVAISADAAWDGKGVLYWCGPSDNPANYGPCLPDKTQQTWLKAQMVGVTPTVKDEATLMRSSRPHYAAVGNLHVSEFSMNTYKALCVPRVIKGGGNTSHVSAAWTYHTEGNVFAPWDSDYLEDGESVPDGCPSDQYAVQHNPSCAFAMGQGFYICENTGPSDITLTVRCTNHYLTSMHEDASRLVINTEAHGILNKARPDLDEHDRTDKAHVSAMSTEGAHDAILQAGSSFLSKIGLSPDNIKHVVTDMGSNPIDKAPTTTLAKATGAWGWLKSHAGGLAAKIEAKAPALLQDAIQVAETVAPALLL